jgi:hypothetical protein
VAPVCGRPPTSASKPRAQFAAAPGRDECLGSGQHPCHAGQFAAGERIRQRFRRRGRQGRDEQLVRRRTQRDASDFDTVEDAHAQGALFDGRQPVQPLCDQAAEHVVEHRLALQPRQYRGSELGQVVVDHCSHTVHDLSASNPFMRIRACGAR